MASRGSQTAGNGEGAPSVVLVELVNPLAALWPSIRR
jgi:hypothetical protein